MNWKAWAPLCVAIILGMVAALTAHNLVGRRPATSAASTAAQIVVVKQPILPGQEIKADDLTIASLAWKESPEGTFKTPNELVGRVATIGMVKGQPVLESLLAAPGTGSGLQALVPDGMRAITIEVNEFGSVAGLVTPGCAVDVVATVEDLRNKEHVARTIVQDVKVMAVGQRTTVLKDMANAAKDAAAAAAAAGTPAPDLFKSVTLLTTPAEAEALELASMIGRPRLILRGSRDTASVKSTGISVAQLAGESDDQASLLTPGYFAAAPAAAPAGAAPVAQAAAAPAPASPPQQQVVRVIRNGVETTLTFPAPAAAPKPQAVAGADTGPAIAR